MAATIPATHQDSLDACVEAISSLEARWTPRKARHCTLRFLGSVAPEAVEHLSFEMAAACSTVHPCVARLSGLGAYPSVRAAKVVWAGLGDDDGSLVELHSMIETAAVKAGFTPEARPFKSHVTLARMKRPISVRSQLEVAQALVIEDAFEISKLTLFESHLHPKGATYEVVADFLLGAGPRSGV
ncbi:MAG: RNA 2',3'-cyclic phosphodiesterase [Actinomycetota bacterium]